LRDASHTLRYCGGVVAGEVGSYPLPAAVSLDSTYEHIVEAERTNVRHRLSTGAVANRDRRDDRANADDDADD
jgi:hypothetical protein